MSSTPGAARGAVAAGHPATAAAGAAVLRAGGNAVDAAVAAVLTSFVAEPLLTGLGPRAATCWSCRPAARRCCSTSSSRPPGGVVDPADRAPLRAVTVDFGDATQVFHAGAASCGTYGTPAGSRRGRRRFGRAPLAELTAPAARLARAGVRVTPMQEYLYALLAEINAATPAGPCPLPARRAATAHGDVVTDPELADALDRFGADGTGTLLHRRRRRSRRRRGPCAGRPAREGRPRRLRGAAPGPRRTSPTATRWSARTRRRARAACWWGGRWPSWPPDRGRRTPPALIAAMAAAERERTPEFLAGLSERHIARARTASGSTTHVSVLDADGWACAVTTSNGEGSGVVVPGTGVHLNNVLGEEDLSPLGFHRNRPAPGCRR